MIYDDERRQQVIDALREGEINRKERERKEKDVEQNTFKENPIVDELGNDIPPLQEDTLR